MDLFRGKQLIDLFTVGYVRLLAILLMITAPFLVVRSTLDWSIEHTLVFIALLSIYVLILLVWTWLISRVESVRETAKRTENGLLRQFDFSWPWAWPLLFSISLVTFSLPLFAGAACFVGNPEHADFMPKIVGSDSCISSLQDLFLWHLLDSIPGLKVPETIAWGDPPFTYSNNRFGWLLLVFKVTVIVPVIATFVAAFKVSKERKQPAT